MKDFEKGSHFFSISYIILWGFKRKLKLKLKEKGNNKK